MQGIITKSGNNIFCRIYGLAVMLSVATWTTNKYIDKIVENSTIQPTSDYV